MKYSAFIATSLDGFIARTNGDIKWLHEASVGVDKGEDFGFQAFFSGIDAMIMGRSTFEIVAAFGDWPYGEIPVLILSSMMVALPKTTPETVTLIKGGISEAIKKAENAGYHHVYVDGGKTIQSFLQAGLLNDITLTTIPIVLGDGIPLFGKVEHDIHLLLLASKAYPNGFVQTHYEIKN